MNKIESLIMSSTSVHFNKFLLEEIELISTDRIKFYDGSTIGQIKDRTAIFDARLIGISYGSEIEIVNNLIWRSCYDCYRNTISTYARHVLGKKEIFKKNGTEMIQMMKENGFDPNSSDVVPLAYKYGVFCKKIEVVHINDGLGVECIRTKPYNFCTNLLEQNRERTLELFLSKYFQMSLINCEPYNL